MGLKGNMCCFGRGRVTSKVFVFVFVCLFLFLSLSRGRGVVHICFLYREG